MSVREVIGVSRSRRVLEGAGVHLRRAFGFHDTELYDPFLFSFLRVSVVRKYRLRAKPAHHGRDAHATKQ